MKRVHASAQRREEREGRETPGKGGEVREEAGRGRRDRDKDRDSDQDRERGQQSH